MYAKKNKTMKALVVALSVVLIMALTVAGTLAYLKVNTESVVNTFSPSNIDLTLKETTTTYDMVPGVDIAKDPKVTVTADIDCYVFVKVVESDNFDTYMTYAIASGWKLYDSGSTTIDTAVNDTYVLYREVSAAEAANGKAMYVLAGDENNTNPNGVVTVKSEVTKTQMGELYDDEGNEINKPTLTFTAYAIQKAGFENDLAGAWTAAQG